MTIAAPASPLSPLPVKSGETLYPGNALGPPNRGQLHSRQASSNSGEGYRESSLDDSGVVDDHEEGDAEDHTQTTQVRIVNKVRKSRNFSDSFAESLNLSLQVLKPYNPN